MKKGLLIVLAAISTLTVGGALPAGATPSTSETIVLMRDSQRLEIGWSASGTFTDSGSWTSDFRAFGGGLSPIFAGTIKTTETGANGSFEMDFQVLSDINDVFSGTWQIVDGTGAYARLRGNGTWTHAVDSVTGNGIFTCTGDVHFN